MDNREARSILSTYRPGEPAVDDGRRDEALRKAEAEQDLAQWWTEEQKLDRIIASKLATTHVPAGLKERIMPTLEARPERVRSTWSRGLLLAAASIVALAVIVGFWRGPFQPAASLADYRDEMVSFIKVAPSLELESSDLGRLKTFLAKANAPARFTVPKNLQKYEPIGCRVLRFRGQDVSLVCFKIGGDRLAHLFVTTPKTVRTGGSATAPVFADEEGWMTATWTEDGQAYLLAVQGNRAATEKFLETT
ncbi:MAG: DUF3379 domain-containing protein [Verrucomicrobiota bacterium]|nr:DUF3379 domain-containing protein [Verrucomicrobiota bacterium]